MPVIATRDQRKGFISILRYIKPGYFILAGLAALAPFLPEVFLWPSELAANFAPHLALAGITLCLISAFSRRPVSAFAAAGLALWLSAPVLAFDRYSVVENQGNGDFSVMSANVLMSESAVRRFLDTLGDDAPEVLVLVDMTEAKCSDFNAVKTTYPYCRMIFRTDRFPLLSKRMALLAKQAPERLEIHAETVSGWRGIIDADFRIAGKLVQIVAVHPANPLRPRGFARRNIKLRLASEVLSQTKPYVLLGDFNTTPWTPSFDLIPGTRAGDPRLESTWITDLPLLGLPIDHVFFSEGLKLTDYKVGPFFGSDHRAVGASFTLSSQARRVGSASLEHMRQE
ncbi:MAG: endonuclease/exonuclease/phosphatase family protein [Pseudomonadota bacterium]